MSQSELVNPISDLGLLSGDRDCPLSPLPPVPRNWFCWIGSVSSRMKRSLTRLMSKQLMWIAWVTASWFCPDMFRRIRCKDMMRERGRWRERGRVRKRASGGEWKRERVCQCFLRLYQESTYDNTIYRHVNVYTCTCTNKAYYDTYMYVNVHMYIVYTWLSRIMQVYLWRQCTCYFNSFEHGFPFCYSFYFPILYILASVLYTWHVYYTL